MKIFLVTRGSQGDVYPYLEIARALKSRGHSVFLSLPKEFVGLAAGFGIEHEAQKQDDITSMLDSSPQIKDLLSWMQRTLF